MGDVISIWKRLDEEDVPYEMYPGESGAEAPGGIEIDVNRTPLPFAPSEEDR